MPKYTTSLLALIFIALIGWLFWIANQGFTPPPDTSDTKTHLAPKLSTEPPDDDSRFGLRQGAFAGLIFFSGLVLINRLKKYQWLTASILLIVITPLALGGFIFSKGPLGLSDWDYYFSYHHVIRETVLNHHAFPAWNPYICGGTSGIGDPEFPLFAPTFLLELIFGIPLGLRLAALSSVAIGALGFLFLSKRLKFSVYASLTVALIAAFGSVNILEVVEGHPNIFAAMWIPWILWSWLRAYKTITTGTTALIKTTIPCGIFLSLTFFQGGIYLLMYLSLVFIGFIIFAKNHKRAFLITLMSGLWALGLAAIKIIPVLLWLTQFQDTAYASSANTLLSLHKIFLGRYLHGSENIIPGQGGGWHEYGAYIGPVALILALVGTLRIKAKRLPRLLVLSAITAIIISATGPILKPLFDEAAFLPRSNISRFILFAIIPLSLLAGFGLDYILSSRKKFNIIAFIITGLVAIDLMSLSYVLSEQAFILPYPTRLPAASTTPLTFTVQDFTTRYNGVDYTRAYAATRAGYGTLSYCSVLGPPPAVTAIEHTDHDPAFVTSNHADTSIKITNWSPSETSLQVTATQPSEVILNTNYAQGWFVNHQPAKEISNRVGTSVAPGTHQLTFRYKPPGFIIGLVITCLTTIMALALLLHHKMFQLRA